MRSHYLNFKYKTMNLDLKFSVPIFRLDLDPKYRVKSVLLYVFLLFLYKNGFPKTKNP